MISVSQPAPSQDPLTSRLDRLLDVMNQVLIELRVNNFIVQQAANINVDLEELRSEAESGRLR